MIRHSLLVLSILGLLHCGKLEMEPSDSDLAETQEPSQHLETTPTTRLQAFGCETVVSPPEISVRVDDNGQFLDPAPTIDIKANGLEGPITVNSESQVTISWTSTNATSCSVPNTSWTGRQGYQVSESLNSNQTYTINCIGSGGSASDSVAIQVSSCSLQWGTYNMCPSYGWWGGCFAGADAAKSACHAQASTRCASGTATNWGPACTTGIPPSCNYQICGTSGWNPKCYCR